MIDVDGSPSGYIAWYNHYAETSRIRSVHPFLKNGSFGVQRMEMVAIYFALADNSKNVRSITKIVNKKKGLIIDIRSDSKSTLEQLQGISKMRDIILHRIYKAIKKLLVETTYPIVFNYVKRTRNIAALPFERMRRRTIHNSHSTCYYQI